MTAFSLRSVRDSRREHALGFLQRIHVLIRWVALHFSGTRIADLAGIPKPVQKAYQEVRGSGIQTSGGGSLDAQFDTTYNPDSVVESFRNPSLNPVMAFHEALIADGNKNKCRADNPFAGQKLRVKEAWLFEGQVDENGKLLRDPVVREAIQSPWPDPVRVRHVRGHESYLEAYQGAQRVHGRQPGRAREGRRLVEGRREVYRRAVEDGFAAGTDVPNNLLNVNFDPNQYTEYAPLTGGPFFRQLYIYDFLRQTAYAFEAQNHNPLAKAIIRILTQYALGRRFDVRIKDEAQERVWTQYAERTDFVKNISMFWGKEAEIYGDFIFNWTQGLSVDPSTVWDIITDPDFINDEYYYYQSYPTAYQMFTGLSIPGQPGSEKQAASEYIIRQIPAHKIVHMKINCVSNEKRGRSSLFAVLGWLKRIKDLYNAQVIRQWLYANFMWDVTLKNANQSDIDSYAAANTAMPLPGSKNIHNDSVEVKPLPALESMGRGGGTVNGELMSFIAVSVGIPKEFLNVVMGGAMGGGGSRASALTSAEPFTKMCEDIQARWEWFVTEVFSRVVTTAGLPYKKGDIEVIFPSVTKDTTTETLKNLVTCEEMKWFTHQMCAEMAAKEMNVTQFDWDQVASQIKDEERAGWTQTAAPGAAAPASRFGSPDGGSNGESPIHGNGKVDLQNELNTL